MADILVRDSESGVLIRRTGTSNGRDTKRWVNEYETWDGVTVEVQNDDR